VDNSSPGGSAARRGERKVRKGWMVLFRTTKSFTSWSKFYHLVKVFAPIDYAYCSKQTDSLLLKPVLKETRQSAAIRNAH
jgi:hypothetical protein